MIIVNYSIFMWYKGFHHGFTAIRIVYGLQVLEFKYFFIDGWPGGKNTSIKVNETVSQISILYMEIQDWGQNICILPAIQWIQNQQDKLINKQERKTFIRSEAAMMSRIVNLFKN